MHRHYDLIVEVFGEKRGSLQFCKVALWYSKRFGPVKPFNTTVVRINSREDFDRVLFLNTSSGESPSLMTPVNSYPVINFLP